MPDQTLEPQRFQPVDIVKWIATFVQLVGYGLTGMNVVPWNILLFSPELSCGSLLASCGRTRRSWWFIWGPFSHYWLVI